MISIQYELRRPLIVDTFNVADYHIELERGVGCPGRQVYQH